MRLQLKCKIRVFALCALYMYALKCVLRFGHKSSTGAVRCLSIIIRGAMNNRTIQSPCFIFNGARRRVGSMRKWTAPVRLFAGLFRTEWDRTDTVRRRCFLTLDGHWTFLNVKQLNRPMSKPTGNHLKKGRDGIYWIIFPDFAMKISLFGLKLEHSSERKTPPPLIQ